jgi:competence protein ComEC
LPTLENKEVIVTVLDVGQGLSVFVKTQNHQLLYDTGARFFNGSDMGKNVVLPFLRYHGIQKLDMLLISHSDNDHSGGAYSVLAKIPTEQILTNSPETLIPYQTNKCETGQTWAWDKVEFSILSPAKNFENDNDNSCVLKIETSKNAILLTGDIEADAENWLVENMPNKLSSTVLLAPHHGSKTSSTLPFLNAVKPKTVLVSAGYRNQFHHPNKDVVARYESLNINMLTSANNGALTIRLNPRDVEIESLRETVGKYWQQPIKVGL